VQTVKPVEGVHFIRSGPKTTKRHPLNRRAKAFRIKWRSRNLQRGTRVALYASPSKGTLARRLRRGLRRSGLARVSPRKLARGRNYLILVTTRGGVITDYAVSRRAIWVGR
jgi:hypothetical protein